MGGWRSGAARLAGRAHRAGAGLLTRFQRVIDGGVERQEFVSGGLSTASLAVAGNAAALGSVGIVQLNGVDDGGLVPFDWSGAPVTTYLDELSLTSSLATNVFFLSCDGGCGGPEQETQVRV